MIGSQNVFKEKIILRIQAEQMIVILSLIHFFSRWTDTNFDFDWYILKNYNPKKGWFLKNVVKCQIASQFSPIAATNIIRKWSFICCETFELIWKLVAISVM